jgi:hypothetical protein
MEITRRLLAAALLVAPAGSALAAQTRPGSGFIRPQNELEKHIDVLARRKTPAARRAFEECFLRSDLYLVTTPEGMWNARIKKSDGAIAVWQGPLSDGRHAVALFTSPERMAQSFYAEDEVPYVKMNGRDTLDLAIGGPLVVNYGLEPPVFIEPDRAKALKAMA